MNGIEEFLKAWNNRPVKKKRIIEYRAYYEGTKIVSTCSGDKDGEWPEGNSIIIDQSLYRNTSALYRMRVIDGKLIQVKAEDPSKLQLEKAKDGKYTTLPNNIIFAAKKGDNYKQKEYNVEISNTSKS